MGARAGRPRAARTTATLLATIVGVLTVLGGCTLPEPRDFSLDTVHVDATLHPDGTLEVSEAVTYTFTGADDEPFTVGTRDFVLGGGTITSIAAYDQQGRQLPTLLSTPTLFEWDISPAYSGTYTYELRYEVTGAVDVGSDVVELNRQWVGTTSPAIGQWSAEITVPGGQGEILVWAHGPLDGVIERDDPEVTAQAPDVAAGQFVETRIATPVERFTVAPGAVELLPSILAEEEAWAAEANAEREAVREAEQRREDIARALDLLVAPLVALAVWGFWMIWRRWGRDPKKPADIGDYWREVPDDPPAVASALLSWGVVGPDAYSATILDLARRGHLRVEEIPVERLIGKDDVEHRFVRSVTPPANPLRSFEANALSWLFAEGATTTQDELVTRNRADQSASHAAWKSFQDGVGAELDARNYIVRGKHAAFALHALIVLGLVGLTIGAVAVGAWIAAIAAGLTALVLLPLGALHRSRTVNGARRFAEWTSLRRFLKDFSRLDEAPVGHLALWEQYLVAAVALGVAEELVEGLETWFPQLLQDGSSSGFAPWYVAAAGSRHGALGAVGSFGSGFGGSAISSSTPQSSGSGGGGGFSGGGGGGGGGGGFGAR